MKEKMEVICVKCRQLTHVYPDQSSVCRIQMLLLIKTISIRKVGDSKVLIRNRNSKKDRQYNCQKSAIDK